MRHNGLENKIAVVTGASSGIGAATAKRLAREGLQVIMLAHRRERLVSLADQIRRDGWRAIPIVADLSCEDERARVFKEIGERFGEADILVNNAGLGWYGYGDEMAWMTAWEMLQVNVEAVVQFTLGFLHRMRARNRGHIINVGSISGSLPSQGIALYGATKSFLDNFTTALYRELGGTRVHLSVVRAGPVKTEFGEATLLRENGLHVPTEKVGVSAERVAERIWDLVRRPRRVVYVPDWMRVVPWVEMAFGWIIDRVGPRLLKRQKTPI